MPKNRWHPPKKESRAGRQACQTPPLSVSQNFLTSGRTISRLLRLTDIGPNDHVLEIGPGKGHITRLLAPLCGTLCAVELDSRLYERLCGQLADIPNLTLRHMDFLRFSLPGTPYKVFANIPFSATSAILKKLTLAENPPQDAWLIVEKGAAKRFCGQPRESTQSLLLRPFFQLRIVRQLRREDYHPAPSVDTVLLHLHRREESDLAVSERNAYERFLKLAKTQGIHRLLTKKQIATALRLEGLPQPAARGDLLYVQWLCLFRCWQRFRGEPT